jgi:hypothetical protein
MLYVFIETIPVARMTNSNIWDFGWMGLCPSSDKNETRERAKQKTIEIDWAFPS